MGPHQRRYTAGRHQQLLTAADLQQLLSATRQQQQRGNDDLIAGTSSAPGGLGSDLGVRQRAVGITGSTAEVASEGSYMDDLQSLAAAVGTAAQHAGSGVQLQTEGEPMPGSSLDRKRKREGDEESSQLPLEEGEGEDRLPFD